MSGDGKINFEDIEWTYLKGDGDFRSDEVKKLRHEPLQLITMAENIRYPDTRK